MAEIETNQIKELIKKGYDLEIISLELDIPKDTIENIQKEVLEEKEMQDKQKQEEEKNEKQEKYEERAVQQNGNLETYKKTISTQIQRNNVNNNILIMRRKYKELLERDTVKKLSVPSELNEEQIKNGDRLLADMEEIVKNISNRTISESQRKYYRSKIIQINKELDTLELTIWQCQKYYELCNDVKLYMEIKEYASSGKSALKYVEHARYKFIHKVQKDIDKITDIEELMKIYNYIRDIVQEDKENSYKYEICIEEIRKKRAKLNKQENDKTKINQSTISSIAQDIARGELDFEKANKIIEQEAEKDLNTKNKFQLSKEAKKVILLHQIGYYIQNSPETFKIINPMLSLEQLKQLYVGTNGELPNHVLCAVVENLINDKRFDEAEDICSRYITRRTVSAQSIINSKYKHNVKKSHEEELSQLATILNNKIKYARIGEIILKILDSNVDSEILYNTVKERIKKNNLDLTLVKLGKTKDGLRIITLKDIWPQEKVR